MKNSSYLKTRSLIFLCGVYTSILFDLVDNSVDGGNLVSSQGLVNLCSNVDFDYSSSLCEGNDYWKGQLEQKDEVLADYWAN